MLEHIKDYALYAGIVLFGAIVHATVQLKVSRDVKSLFRFSDFIILFIIATFAGLISGLLSSLFSQSIVWISLFSGIGSFLGLIGLNKIATVGLSIITGLMNNSLSNKNKDE